MRPLEAAIHGWQNAWPAAIEVLLRHGARPKDVEGLFTQVAEVVGRLPRGGDTTDDAMKSILAAFRPLWKVAHGRDNRRLKEALWLDEGEAQLKDLGPAGGMGAPVFAALFSEESALDGLPTLKEFARQRQFWAGAEGRQWDQATITRQVDGQETVIPVNLVAMAQGKSPEPPLHWGDVVSIPASGALDMPVERLVRGWWAADVSLTLRLDLGHAGVVSNRPPEASPLWDVKTLMAPDMALEMALETVVRRAGIPRELLNLGVTVKRPGADGAMAPVPNADSPPVRHGDIVSITPPELKPSLSEEAMRGGAWLCKSMDGPFWPVNPMVELNGFIPPLGYLLLALQAPHPTVFHQVDWEKASLRTWDLNTKAVAAGQATWNEEPLLSAWSAARLRPGQVLILPSVEGAAREMPAELKDGLAQMGFEWSLQIGTAAGIPRIYRPRFFARQLAGGRVVWSDVERDGPEGPVLPLSRDLVAMSKVLTDGLPFDADPLQSGTITGEIWARPNGTITYNERVQRRRIVLPTRDAPQ